MDWVGLWRQHDYQFVILIFEIKRFHTNGKDWPYSSPSWYLKKPTYSSSRVKTPNIFVMLFQLTASRKTLPYSDKLWYGSSGPVLLVLLGNLALHLQTHFPPLCSLACGGQGFASPMMVGMNEWHHYAAPLSFLSQTTEVNKCGWILFSNSTALMAMTFSVSNSNKEMNVLAAYQNQRVSGCGPQATAVHRHVSNHVFR